jgi:hypothetical protein
MTDATAPSGARYFEDYVADRGLVRTLFEVLNQEREVVMSLKAMNLIRCHSLPVQP